MQWTMTESQSWMGQGYLLLTLTHILVSIVRLRLPKYVKMLVLFKKRITKASPKCRPCIVSCQFVGCSRPPALENEILLRDSFIIIFCLSNIMILTSLPWVVQTHLGR